MIGRGANGGCAWCSRRAALERIADNAVDIAEQVSYVVTGELREFSDASHPPDEHPREAA